MNQTPAERAEVLERVYEDIRRAMNNRDFDRAARLSVQLAGELADDEFILSQRYPICLECNGYAEVVDPEHPERKTACASAPKACPGNQGGRMNPAQYKAYLDAALTPRKPTVIENVQHPDAPGGDVPKLPPDDLKPTPSPSGQVDRPEELSEERPPLVQS